MSNILVVDDEHSVLEALKLILADQGYRVDLAPDAEAALVLMQHNRYDLVVTDLLMPKLDGFEFIKTIRLKWGRQLPVIIITAHGTVEIASLALNQGVADFIIKPFDIKTVSQAVQYALTRNPSVLDINEQSLLGGSAGDAEFEKKFFGLSMLDEVSKKINSAAEVEPIGLALVELVQRALRPDRGLVVVYDPNGMETTFQRLFNQEQLTGEGPSAVDRGILEWITKSSQPLLVEDMARDTQCRACLHGMLSSGSLLAVPFKRRGKIWGAMILYRQAGLKPFESNAMQMLSIFAGMAATAIENAALYQDLKTYFTGTIRALITAVEIKDPMSFGHSNRVARYALMMGKQLQMNDVELRRLEYLALLHDIGKLGIPETVLNKPSQLTAEEWELMKTHVGLGENIVRSIHFLPTGDKIVRSHHERFDGHGYPDGLHGEDIPLLARVISIADAFDAMTSARSYRKLLEPPEAMNELQQCAGKQFDPYLVRVFQDAYNEWLQAPSKN